MVLNGAHESQYFHDHKWSWLWLVFGKRLRSFDGLVDVVQKTPSIHCMFRPHAVAGQWCAVEWEVITAILWANKLRLRNAHYIETQRLTVLLGHWARGSLVEV